MAGTQCFDIGLVFPLSPVKIRISGDRNASPSSEGVRGWVINVDFLVRFESPALNKINLDSFGFPAESGEAESQRGQKYWFLLETEKSAHFIIGVS